MSGLSLSDREHLGAAGCDLAQGYFIAQLMLGAKLPSWVTAWEHRHRKPVEMTG